MKNIQILGTGCPKCKRLTENALAAADKLGIDYNLEKVTEIDRILGFGVMMTPALVIDGKVVASGSVPSSEEIAKMLNSDKAKEAGESPKKGGCCCGGSC